MESVTLDLLSHRRISLWAPKHGDVIHYKGWFGSWVGVVSGIDGHEIAVIIAGTPVELISYTQSEMLKNTKHIDVGSIRRSKASYGVQTVENGISVWYV